jgi:hypothetical protein
LIQSSYVAKFYEREMKTAGNDTATNHDTAADIDTKSAAQAATAAADHRPRLDSGAK